MSNSKFWPPNVSEELIMVYESLKLSRKFSSDKEIIEHIHKSKKFKPYTLEQITFKLNNTKSKPKVSLPSPIASANASTTTTHTIEENLTPALPIASSKKSSHSKSPLSDSNSTKSPNPTKSTTQISAPDEANENKSSQVENNDGKDKEDEQVQIIDENKEEEQVGKEVIEISNTQSTESDTISNETTNNETVIKDKQDNKETETSKKRLAEEDVDENEINKKRRVESPCLEIVCCNKSDEEFENSNTDVDSGDTKDDGDDTPLMGGGGDENINLLSMDTTAAAFNELLSSLGIDVNKDGSNSNNSNNSNNNSNNNDDSNINNSSNNDNNENKKSDENNNINNEKDSNNSNNSKNNNIITPNKKKYNKANKLLDNIIKTPRSSKKESTKSKKSIVSSSTSEEIEDYYIDNQMKKEFLEMKNIIKEQSNTISQLKSIIEELHCDSRVLSSGSAIIKRDLSNNHFYFFPSLISNGVQNLKIEDCKSPNHYKVVVDENGGGNFRSQIFLIKKNKDYGPPTLVIHKSKMAIFFKYNQPKYITMDCVLEDS